MLVVLPPQASLHLAAGDHRAHRRQKLLLVALTEHRQSFHSSNKTHKHTPF